MNHSLYRNNKTITIAIILLLIVFLGVIIFLLLKNKPFADSPIEPEYGGFYGMKIESVSAEQQNNIVVTTTGSIYTINSDSIEMSRRVDPKTNTINPKVVASLDFNLDLGQLTVTNSDEYKVILTSPNIVIEINSDSFFTVKALSDFSYTHNNSVKDATYNKGTGLNKIWTDGYGGSLHAVISGSPTVLFQDTDYTTIQMKNDDIMSHMAFPPKRFNFDKLYGSNSLPFDRTIKSLAEIPQNSEDFQKDKDKGIGVYILWNQIYECGRAYPAECSRPVTLPATETLPERKGYKLKEEVANNLEQAIQTIQQNGIKVILYHHAPGNYSYWGDQTYRHALNQMKELKQQYKFDGWYLDGGSNTGDLLESYNFIKEIRQDVGNNGIIISHVSVDPWDHNRDNLIPKSERKTSYSGLKAVMLDSYSDYALTGETGDISKIFDINDPYLRFFTSGYGMSQTFGTYTGRSDGRSSIERKHGINRLLVQNLNSSAKGGLGEKDSLSYSYYNQRKNEYLSDNFNPDVKWPIDTKNDWFKEISPVSDFQIISTGPNSVIVKWKTEEESIGQVKIADSNGIWAQPPAKINHASFANNDSFMASKKTISFWAKPNCISNTVKPIFSSSSANYYVGFSKSQMIFYYLNSSGESKSFYTGEVKAGEWHKYTYTFDVQNNIVVLKAYIDDILVGTKTNNDGHSDIYGTAYILGGYTNTSGDYTYSGGLDELLFSETANDGSESSALMHFKFDEGQGTSFVDSKGQAISGNIVGAKWKDDSDCQSGSCLYFDNANACVINDSAKSKEHTVSIDWLEPGEEYLIRIFSDNELAGDDGVVWYYLGDLTPTPPNDEDGNDKEEPPKDSEESAATDNIQNSTPVVTSEKTGSKHSDSGDSSEVAINSSSAKVKSAQNNQSVSLIQDDNQLLETGPDIFWLSKIRTFFDKLFAGLIE